MSKQIGITRTTTQPDKSNNVNPVMTNKTDLRGLAVLVVSASIMYILFWLLAVGIAAIRCATSDSYVCNDTTYVFYGGLIVPLLVLIAVLTPTMVQVVKNMSFRLFSGIYMHRDDLRTNAVNLIPVAHRYAESLATSGADNYAPSDSHNGGNTTTNNTAASDNAADVQSNDSAIPLELLNDL